LFVYGCVDPSASDNHVVIIHIGKEVAIFAEHVFIKELLKEQKFIEKDYGGALRDCFHRIDELIETGVRLEISFRGKCID
jgi:hypothetical protein